MLNQGVLQRSGLSFLAFHSIVLERMMEVVMRQSGRDSLMSRIVHIVKGRREIGRLVELDDNALRDIGLTRTDVAGALAASLFRDPSFFLKQVCCGRPLRVSEIQTCC